MNNIPTADEFLECQSLKIPHNLDRDGIAYPSTYVIKKMIEFAKLHVKSALEAAAENAEMFLKDEFTESSDIDKDSILNAYSINLIK